MLTSLLAGLLSLLLSLNPIQAEPSDRDGRDYVCAPRLQLRQPQLCPRHGPGAEVTELARLGLLPPKPLPLASVDSSLGYLPFDYLKTGSGATSLYSSAQDAAAGGGGASSIAGGFVYLSYYDRLDQSGTAVYSTPSGYVRGSSVSRVELPRSPGLVFSRTPDRPFAWIVAGGTCTAREPGGSPDYSNGRCFTRHSVVQIYDTQRVDEWDWYMIGPNEWVEQRLLAVVDPDPTPPQGVDEDRWVSVNLYEQTVAVYENGSLQFATVASSGRNGFWTQPGLFQVWAKLELDDMTGGIPGEDGNYYLLQNVPWVLYFDQSRALHGTYWHSKFGVPTSRGCVNLAPVDANWIFDFAQEGTWVHVWDPSGSTPTDPAQYGPGGA
jgi:hypothetical protein